MLILPNKRRSGTRINSIMFMAATSRICVQAHQRGRIPLKIQINIPISSSPMALVANAAWVSPNIRATISRCLGTRSNTLQSRPLISHTEAIAAVSNVLRFKVGRGESM